MTGLGLVVIIVALQAAETSLPLSSNQGQLMSGLVLIFAVMLGSAGPFLRKGRLPVYVGRGLSA